MGRRWCWRIHVHVTLGLGASSENQLLSWEEVRISWCLSARSMLLLLCWLRSLHWSRPFVVGDLVLMNMTPSSSSSCLTWVVVGSNVDGNYNVECSGNDELAAVVEKGKLAYADADAFLFDCGEYSATGVCGPLQLCSSSHDSIDKTCPGTLQNKSATLTAYVLSRLSFLQQALALAMCLRCWGSLMA